MTSRSAVAGAAASLAAVLLAAAPARSQNDAATKAQQAIAGLPLGDVPFGPREVPAVGTPNPLQGHADAIQQGRTLYQAMNCAYCHGFDAGGLMGPGLTDHRWRYGGHPAEVFNSIAEGRPQGMPAWGTALPPDSIWQIVAYLESLGGVLPPDASKDQGDIPGGSLARGPEHAPSETGSTMPSNGPATVK
jgi:cytochrome c oxidase cbb3-type subunit 3